MDTATWFTSRTARRTLIALGALIALLLTFKAGTAVGFWKARFAYRWDTHYERNFAGSSRECRGPFADSPMMMGAHGTAGAILSIDGATIVIRGRDALERMIVMSDATHIQRFRTRMTREDLAVGDSVVVIGQPNDTGQIEAKFIRILPPAMMRGSEGTHMRPPWSVRPL